jgi:hypothetical protein
MIFDIESQIEKKNVSRTDFGAKILQLTHVLKTQPLHWALRWGHASEGHTKLCKIPSLCQDALLHSYIKNGLCVAFVTLSRQVQPRDWCRIEETSATTSSWVKVEIPLKFFYASCSCSSSKNKHFFGRILEIKICIYRG